MAEVVLLAVRPEVADAVALAVVVRKHSVAPAEVLLVVVLLVAALPAVADEPAVVASPVLAAAVDAAT